MPLPLYIIFYFVLMKSKNLVSLSVAAVFFVLALTGLLIYFGQGTHIVEHTHAWFGILFVTAAVFHIVNNWSSLVGYSKNRRTGSWQKELFLPLLIVAIFAAGIGFGIPVFDKLANAGKELVRGPKPRQEPMPQAKVDSIANVVETAYARAYTTGDTAALAIVMPAKTAVLTEAGTILHRADLEQDFLKRTTPDTLKNTVTSAETLDDHLIIVRGNSTSSAVATMSVYTHVLKEQGNTWQIVAAQRAYPALQ